jgi:DNA-binding NarL/FixJ family response regulator
MIRILIVAGIRLYRDGLSHVLDGHDGLRVVGAVADAREACIPLTELTPDVVVLDMATAENYAMARELRHIAPSIPVVAIGVADSDGEVLTCAELGAAGYVTRDGSIDALVAAVQSAARGELICSPRMAGTLVRRLATLAAEYDPRI